MKGKIINNNSPDPFACAPVGSFKRINPDKFTFLKSNQLIPSYVNEGNVEENPQTIRHLSPMNSYAQCEKQEKIYREKKQRDRSHKNYALKQAKQNSTNYHYELIREEKQIDEEAKQIANMVQNIGFKVADIMNGRLTSFSRNTTQVSHKDLKYLKEGTFQQKLTKIEQTKKLMKQWNNSHQLSKQKLAKQQSFIDKDQHNTTNASNDSSLFSSVVNNFREERQQSINDNYKSLRKVKSFESIYNAQRRRAVKNAFGHYWKQGNADKKTKQTSLFDIDKEEERPKERKKRSKKMMKEMKSAYEKVENQLNPQYVNNMLYSNLFSGCTNKFSITLK